MAHFQSSPLTSQRGTPGRLVLPPSWQAMTRQPSHHLQENNEMPLVATENGLDSLRSLVNRVVL